MQLQNREATVAVTLNHNVCPLLDELVNRTVVSWPRQAVGEHRDPPRGPFACSPTVDPLRKTASWWPLATKRRVANSQSAYHAKTRELPRGNSHLRYAQRRPIW